MKIIKDIVPKNLSNLQDVFYTNYTNNNKSTISANYSTANININTSNNFRNNMSLSKILKRKYQKPQLTQQPTSYNSHKNIFSSNNKEKSFEEKNNKSSNLNNKNSTKKERYKRIKRENEKEIEKILNKKINKKFNNFNDEIEDKIESFLRPTFRKLEKNLQSNLDSIKEKLRSHSVNYSQTNIKNIKSTRAIINANDYSSYLNEVKNTLDNNNNINMNKGLYQINYNILNDKENTYENNDDYGEEKINNNNSNSNSIETEKIKRNIVKKQKQLNNLLSQLNNKQNESLNNYISFRKDNRNYDTNFKTKNTIYNINENINYI